MGDKICKLVSLLVIFGNAFVTLIQFDNVTELNIIN